MKLSTAFVAAALASAPIIHASPVPRHVLVQLRSVNGHAATTELQGRAPTWEDIIGHSDSIINPAPTKLLEEPTLESLQFNKVGSLPDVKYGLLSQEPGSHAASSSEAAIRLPPPHKDPPVMVDLGPSMRAFEEKQQFAATHHPRVVQRRVQRETKQALLHDAGLPSAYVHPVDHVASSSIKTEPVELPSIHPQTASLEPMEHDHVQHRPLVRDPAELEALLHDTHDTVVPVPHEALSQHQAELEALLRGSPTHPHAAQVHNPASPEHSLPHTQPDHHDAQLHQGAHFDQLGHTHDPQVYHTISPEPSPHYAQPYHPDAHFHHDAQLHNEAHSGQLNHLHDAQVYHSISPEHLSHYAQPDHHLAPLPDAHFGQLAHPDAHFGELDHSHDGQVYRPIPSEHLPLYPQAYHHDPQLHHNAQFGQLDHYDAHFGQLVHHDAHLSQLVDFEPFAHDSHYQHLIEPDTSLHGAQWPQTAEQTTGKGKGISEPAEGSSNMGLAKEAGSSKRARRASSSKRAKGEPRKRAKKQPGEGEGE